MHNTVNRLTYATNRSAMAGFGPSISQVSCCTKTNPANDSVAVLAALKAVSRKSFNGNSSALHAESADQEAPLAPHASSPRVPIRRHADPGKHANTAQEMLRADDAAKTLCLGQMALPRSQCARRPGGRR
jgi:hypothetical protein